MRKSAARQIASNKRLRHPCQAVKRARRIEPRHDDRRHEQISCLVAQQFCPAAIEPILRRSEEHTSELQSLMRISYAVFCLKNKKKRSNQHNNKLTNKPKPSFSEYK